MKLRVPQRWTAVWLATIAIVFIAFVCAAPFAVRADDTGGQGIQISPVLIDLNADKANNYDLKLTVTNVTAGELALKAAVNDFRAKDESGEPQVITDENDRNDTFSFRSWVTLPPTFILKSKESRQIVVPVRVPANAETGGHYGVIRFSGVPPELANANVALTASVGVLVLTRVGGEAIKENLTVKEFFVEHKGKRGGIFESGPVSFVQRLENSGNVHLKPTGKLVVKNMLGNTVDTISVNETNRAVLPGSVRRFSQNLDKDLLPGRYTATLNLTYGTTGGVALTSTSFWVIPIKTVALGLIGLVLIILALRWVLRRYRAKVIRQHNQKQK